MLRVVINSDSLSRAMHSLPSAIGVNLRLFHTCEWSCEFTPGPTPTSIHISNLYIYNTPACFKMLRQLISTPSVTINSVTVQLGHQVSSDNLSILYEFIRKTISIHELIFVGLNDNAAIQYHAICALKQSKSIRSITIDPPNDDIRCSKYVTWLYAM